MTGPELELVQAEHHVPDGTRALVIGRRIDGLEAVAYDGEPVQCYMARHNAGHLLPPPPGCREVITAGDHCLRHQEHDAAGRPVRPTGFYGHYCAPCAIREWRPWDVREVAP